MSADGFSTLVRTLSQKAEQKPSSLFRTYTEHHPRHNPMHSPTHMCTHTHTHGSSVYTKYCLLFCKNNETVCSMQWQTFKTVVCYIVVTYFMIFCTYANRAQICFICKYSLWRSLARLCIYMSSSCVLMNAYSIESPSVYAQTVFLFKNTHPTICEVHPY